MRMGIKEFRARISEVAKGREPVVVTNHGKAVAIMRPLNVGAAREFDADRWLSTAKKYREDWKANTPDWHERLLAVGRDEEGELLSR